jgi:hypothetical protein
MYFGCIIDGLGKALPGFRHHQRLHHFWQLRGKVPGEEPPILPIKVDTAYMVWQLVPGEQQVIAPVRFLMLIPIASPV